MPPKRARGLLVPLHLNLLRENKYPAAETYLRDFLMIREKKLPDDWVHFQTKSRLGGALAGQKKFQEVEPRLIEGYSGMKWLRDWHNGSGTSARRFDRTLFIELTSIAYASVYLYSIFTSQRNIATGAWRLTSGDPMNAVLLTQEHQSWQRNPRLLTSTWQL